MPPWFADALARLGAEPLLQATLAAVSTFILEDLTTVGCGLLVADGKMAWATALIGVSVGIALGDVGLYALGRWAGPTIARRGWVSRGRLDRASRWFRRNLVHAVVLSRFVPGMRLPTYVGAGILHAPFWRFVGLAVGASMAWTLLILWLTIHLGQAVLPVLGRWRWPAALVVLVGLVLAQRLAARRLDRDAPGAEDPVVSRFEFWPPWLFYVPVAFYYLWLSVRFRGPMLPTVANPSIFSGGLIGESKAQILDLVPPGFREWIAPYVLFPRSDAVDADRSVEAARRTIASAGLDFPLVAKPDVGQRGDGVRPIRDLADLETYVREFPPGGRIVFQTLVGGSGEPGAVREAGLFYWRCPDEARGRLFSITLKWMPEVVGDGTRTLRE